MNILVKRGEDKMDENLVVWNVELKESEDQGFIIDVFRNAELFETATYLYGDLEEQFRNYLKDVSDDDNFDIKTIENWSEWVKEEKDVLKELNFEKAKE